MSRFAPVHLPEDRRPNGRLQQTFLRHANACMRSGFLYLLHRGEASTPEMERGKALHAVIERSIALCIEQGETTVPPEVVKVIVNEVLTEFAVPIEEHDYLREAAFRWAAETAVDPQAVVALETLFVLDVGGYQVRCRIDFAELLEGGRAVAVKDWKSSRAAPSFEELARKRADGSFSAKSFQLVLYALALRFGQPVREQTCLTCDGGRLRFDDGGPEPQPRAPCPVCRGAGRVEVIEPFPVADRAERFDLEFVFPGIEDREGAMLRRPVSLTRLELDEYRESLGALVARVRAAEESGDWPAVTSDAACGECPAAWECPIPAELRDHRGTINTLEEAAEAAEVLDRRAAVDAAIRKEIKAFAKSTGFEIPVGSDRVWRFVPTAAERIADKEGMWEAVGRAVDYGEPFERDRWVKVVEGTAFKVEKVEAEGSNG